MIDAYSYFDAALGLVSFIVFIFIVVVIHFLPHSVTF